ncbi:NAD(P)/FAD-dependent oxidoreductase [Clostridium sp. 'White wine YQ']|uniref:NAD(P)/FAD-dependent oxidoreductase n=1 Tax=Clostridium sp. 'White wine YQ' TaxID=3027474 RepID=UPI0023667D0F|nr:FAD-dependent oxidoreductase [Clostridium sp. 'White wine YQ']MDD7793902.1 FAD-dependent oxidoreductase [Clostridium sp. 'White wine YQ']
MKDRIIIIGSGTAALSSIKAIREINTDSEILVLGEENFYPYYRTKISKGLLDGLNEDKLLLKKKDWYSSNNVKIHLGHKVISIEPDKKAITLENGKTVIYDKLLITTGATNNIPPINGINKTGAFTLRNLNNAYDVLDYINVCETILLIGGGIQNLEVANILSKEGKKVIIAEFAARLMPKLLDDYASNYLKEAMESQGVKILLNTQVEEIQGDEKVQGFKTKSGIEYSCDMIIYSTGIKPNVEIAYNTQIEINKGIIVNEKMETNIKDIFAAGDVTEFNSRVYGLWNISSEQGNVAGANICGEDSIFTPPIQFSSMNAFDLSLFSIGDIEESNETNLFTQIDLDKENSKYYKVLVRNDKIVGAIILGDQKRAMIIKKLIENKVDIKYDESSFTSINDFIEIIKTLK